MELLHQWRRLGLGKRGFAVSRSEALHEPALDCGTFRGGAAHEVWAAQVVAIRRLSHEVCDCHAVGSMP
jgi:hypothetical protein